MYSMKAPILGAIARKLVLAILNGRGSIFILLILLSPYMCIFVTIIIKNNIYQLK